MSRTRPSRLPATFVLLALVACGGGDAEGRPSDPGGSAAPAAGAGAANVVAAGAADSIEVTLDGRAFPGTHRATGSLGCTMYGGVWQATFEDRGATGLSALLVQLKEVPAAGGSTDRVTLSLVFGQLDDMSGTAGVVDVAGAEAGGDARGAVTRDGGAGAVLRVEGTAQHGARVTAVVRCASVELLR